MEIPEESSNSQNAVRTDLSLLLQSLKFQMKCPDLQKQALLAIHSICENREDNVDILRKMGGVAFVYNLFKSRIVHSDVKETALFTLSTLAEANVYCKNSLNRKETFVDLAGLLMTEDVPLTQKRVSVYLLSVLVANNNVVLAESGQTLAQNTGCLDILLELFRITFPFSKEATLRSVNATQIYQLWTSVCSALCGCVNNPQNEEGQRICVAVFPIIKMWLQQIVLSRTEIFQSVCSFIAMTVANNSGVQESFSASGGLDSLTLALVHLASTADTSFLSCQLSVTLSKTLSACITDNSSLASGLAQYGVVSQLFFLLASPHLVQDEILSVLLTMAQCTAASEEHQSQLVQCGGLPLIITLLTEDASEEVRKAATFILQTCKQATMSLEVPGLTARQGRGDGVEPITNLEGFRSSARELLQRIDQLEMRQEKAEKEQRDTEPSVLTRGLDQQSALSAFPLPLQQKDSMKAMRQTSTPQHLIAKDDNNTERHTARNVTKNDGKWRNMNSDLGVLVKLTKTSGDDDDVWCPECKGPGALMTSHLQPPEGDAAQQPADRNLFKLPAAVKHSVPKETMKEKNDKEELQDCEMSKKGKIQMEEHSVSQIRCAGCVLPFGVLTSRTFSSLQSSCRHSCDMHKVLQEASERFRTAHLLFSRDDRVEQASSDFDSVSLAEPQTNWRDFCLTPRRKAAGKGKSFLPDHNWRKHSGVALTPMSRGAANGLTTSHKKTELISTLLPSCPSLTPLKKSHLPGDRRDGNKSGPSAVDDEMKTCTDDISFKRARKDFSREEVHYLLCGVEKLGFSWNSILWSYPFQPGRTNVDLAKKYKRLTKAGAADV